MALIFNNLVINKNSTRYTPFLLNLISGRRRLLSTSEFRIISSMLDKQNLLSFNIEENELFEKLKKEKQFIHDEERNYIEKKMLEANYFSLDNIYNNDCSFSIQITQDCNMNCQYCFVKKYQNKFISFSKDHVDAIYNFYRKKKSFLRLPIFE